MDTTKIDKIEEFANINANIRMMGYDPAAKKTGLVPISAVQSKIPYCGCRWRKDSSSPEGEPIGDLQMLAQLPSILGLGGYLVQNDHSRRKLASDTHFKFAYGRILRYFPSEFCGTEQYTYLRRHGPIRADNNSQRRRLLADCGEDTYIINK